MSTLGTDYPWLHQQIYSKDGPSKFLNLQDVLLRHPYSRDDLSRYFSVWDVISAFVHPQDENARYWWHATGSVLAQALRQANYSPEDQYNSLLFHLKIIAPCLGPRPQPGNSSPSWKSFMTDDFSPIEYSWHWGTGSKSPDIRYSIEAIGPEANTPSDPFNQKMSLSLISRLKKELPLTDWTWFDTFHEAFQVAHPQLESSHTADASTSTDSSSSSIFLAFELRRGRTVVPKAYFAPTKQPPSCESSLSTVTKGILSLPTTRSSHQLDRIFPAYTQLLEFLNSDPEGRLLSLVFIAIDCLPEGQQSRLKIYLRSPHTSFDSVSRVLSMGGTLKHLTRPRNVDNTTPIQSFRTLFYNVLSLPNSHLSSSPLPTLRPTTQQTSGMLYYFDVAPHCNLPSPKVYIPVKYYSPSDTSALHGLRQWFKGSVQGEWSGRFEELAGRIEVRKEGTGCLTYTSVGFRTDGSLDITSYFGGEGLRKAKVCN